MLSDPSTMSLQGFVFWTPPPGRCLTSGPEQRAVPLPETPLPIRGERLPEDLPSDTEIGESLYACLRQHPDCPDNRLYARLLGEGFPHLIADIGAQIVMLDAKQVDSGYQLRKVRLLKILALLDEANAGLCLEIGRNLFELALTFTELPHCRALLLECLAWLQRTLRLRPDDPLAHNLLGEVDFILGDYPGAASHWQSLADSSSDPSLREQLADKINLCLSGDAPSEPLLDALEALGQTLVMAGAGQDEDALRNLAALEQHSTLLQFFPLPEFHYLRGVLYQRGDEPAAALRSYHAALDIAPDFEPARAAVAQLSNT